LYGVRRKIDHLETNSALSANQFDLSGKSCYTLIDLTGKGVITLTELNTNEPKIQRILNAGLREFSQRGYDEASTNRIAKAAGISKALMFHYVKSKEELFLLLLDYCQKTMTDDYWDKLDWQETDIFKRLLQSYTLQIDLMKKHPWIFDFTNLQVETKSAAINETNFRTGLDVARCKQLILWGNIGFTNEIVEEIKKTDYDQLDYQAITDKLTQYLEDLRSVFYEE
jgi:AcrR family transcriptional regulator